MLLNYPLCDRRQARAYACARLAVSILWIVIVAATVALAQTSTGLLQVPVGQSAKPSAAQSNPIQDDKKANPPAPPDLPTLPAPPNLPALPAPEQTASQLPNTTAAG